MGRKPKDSVKDNLSELAANFENLQDIVATNEATEEVPGYTTKPVVHTEPRPDQTDVGWHNYVMSKLDESEMQNGNPKVDGLRRLVKLLLGTITNEQTSIFETNREFAAVTVQIKIRSFDNEHLVVEGSADAHNQNAPAPFCFYCLALAETRATGRAFRKLLGLRGTICAEESVEFDKTPVSNNVSLDNVCPEELIHCIGILAKRANLNIIKYMESINIKDGRFTKQMADVVHSACNEFANGTKPVTSDLLGFQSNWTQELKK